MAPLRENLGQKNCDLIDLVLDTVTERPELLDAMSQLVEWHDQHDMRNTEREHARKETEAIITHKVCESRLRERYREKTSRLLRMTSVAISLCVGEAAISVAVGEPAPIIVVQSSATLFGLKRRFNSIDEEMQADRDAYRSLTGYEPWEGSCDTR